MKKLDFLAIGDTTIDAFIKLKDAHIDCEHGNCELCLNFGGKIEYEKVVETPAAGNSANASICASRLCLNTALMTNIGEDKNGTDCLNKLKEEKVDTDFIKIEKGISTNYHYVLCYDRDRTILVKHEKYNYELPEILKDENYISPSWIYLSSMGENSLDFTYKISEYLNKNPNIKLAFQPGTFQIKIGKEKLKDIYLRTEIFFSNIEEAQKILNTENRDIKELVRGIHTLGPKIVALTDAKNGAYLYINDELFHMPTYKTDEEGVEYTGAGDAFSSTFVSAIILGKEYSQALSWAQINAMSVIRYIGSQEGLLNKEKIEEYIKNASEDYKITKI